MSKANATETISAFAQNAEALSSLLWPVILAVLLWKLFPLVRGIVESRPFTVKVGDMEISVQSASDQLQKQIEDLTEQVIDLRKGQPQSIQPLQAEKPVNAPIAPAPVILWVDDKPQGNAVEIAQINSLGIKVITALSTAEAMGVLSKEAVGVVISDMGRAEANGYRSDAGLELLDSMRDGGFDQPFMIYTGRRSAERARHGVGKKGDGATYSPVELMTWVQTKLT